MLRSLALEMLSAASSPLRLLGLGGGGGVEK